MPLRCGLRWSTPPINSPVPPPTSMTTRAAAKSWAATIFGTMVRVRLTIAALNRRVHSVACACHGIAIVTVAAQLRRGLPGANRIDQSAPGLREHLALEEDPVLEGGIGGLVELPAEIGHGKPVPVGLPAEAKCRQANEQSAQRTFIGRHQTGESRPLISPHRRWPRRD